MGVRVVGGPVRFRLVVEDAPPWEGTLLLVDRHAPDSSLYYMAGLPSTFDGRRSEPMVIISPTAWATQSAHNLAAAYRPEGVP